MQIRPRKILWPTDFSDNAMKAAQYAQAFREAFNAKLFVLNVAAIIVPAGPSMSLMAGGEMLATATDVRSYAEDALKDLVDHQFKDSESVTRQVLVGNAWYEICQYAQHNKIDLIVMATHGHTGLRRLFIGSTAERVVQHANCPVLTVKSFGHGFLKPSKPSAARKAPPGKRAGAKITRQRAQRAGA